MIYFLLSSFQVAPVFKTGLWETRETTVVVIQGRGIRVSPTHWSSRKDIRHKPRHNKERMKSGISTKCPLLSKNKKRSTDFHQTHVTPLHFSFMGHSPPWWLSCCCLGTSSHSCIVRCSRPDSACVFHAPVLKAAISPKSPLLPLSKSGIRNQDLGAGCAH